MDNGIRVHLAIAPSSTAWALPNPFVVTLALDMLAQAALVALLFVPKAVTVSKRLFARYLSSANARAFGVMAVLAVALAALLGRARTDRMVVPQTSFEERFEPARSSTSKKAKSSASCRAASSWTCGHRARLRPIT